MRVSLGLPTHRVDLGNEFVSAAGIAEVAFAAEGAGFDAVFVTEHPYPGREWLASGGHHALDPFVALSFAAAATTRLRLQTNLFIAAYRNPFLAAKTVATLDALSGGRVILGIGAGYLEPEFAALGVPFEERNDLADEAIAAMTAAWSGEPVTWQGRHFHAPGNQMLPRPGQLPHPPIWIGGNSRRAIRRAVELADGWVPMPSPARAARLLHTPGLASLDELQDRLDYAAAHAAAVGRDRPLEVAFMPAGLNLFAGAAIDPAVVLAEVTALVAVGVSYLLVNLPAGSRRELLDAIERFGAEVLPRLPSG
ncbi:MAG: LLM class F420-dependent oxidoreductase [Mycobacteriales bacterium]